MKSYSTNIKCDNKIKINMHYHYKLNKFNIGIDEERF